jgi:hypothetical protein
MLEDNFGRDPATHEADPHANPWMFEVSHPACMVAEFLELPSHSDDWTVRR